ncbi:MAG: alpha/beta fold hydrolase [Actinobacteria bacterium]|nr:alpha/beta fold hydrolase [Actinomycetota bacterium]
MHVTRVPVSAGVSLAVQVWPGDKLPFLLVHGLASNALLWQGVAEALSSAGHGVAAVDQRGHGQSDKPDDGYDFATVASDLAAVITGLGWKRPVVAGQSWGGNVALQLAARPDAPLLGLVLVDGGWIDLSHFASWEECERAMAPPPVPGTPVTEMEAMLRRRHPDWPESGIRGQMACYQVREDATVAPWLTLDRHLTILRHLWEHRPATLYPLVEVPVLLLPCDDGSSRKRDEVAAAEAGLARSRTLWQPADHDVHAQHPEKVADLLLGCVDDGFFG